MKKGPTGSSTTQGNPSGSTTLARSKNAFVHPSMEANNNSADMSNLIKNLMSRTSANSEAMSGMNFSDKYPTRINVYSNAGTNASTMRQLDWDQQTVYPGVNIPDYTSTKPELDQSETNSAYAGRGSQQAASSITSQTNLGKRVPPINTLAAPGHNASSTLSLALPMLTPDSPVKRLKISSDDEFEKDRSDANSVNGGSNAKNNIGETNSEAGDFNGLEDFLYDKRDEIDSFKYEDE